MHVFLFFSSFSPAVFSLYSFPSTMALSLCPSRKHCSLLLLFIPVIGKDECVERRGHWLALLASQFPVNLTSPNVACSSSRRCRSTRQFVKIALNSLFSCSFCFEWRLSLSISGSNLLIWLKILAAKFLFRIPSKHVTNLCPVTLLVLN